MWFLLACPKPVEVAEVRVEEADPAAVAVLEKLAAELDVGIRRRAISALIRTQSEKAGGAWGLRGRWDPSPYVQRATVSALASRGKEAESLAILKQLTEAESVESYTRGYAGLALARLEPSTELAAWLLQLANPLKRWAAGGLYLAAAKSGATEGAEQVLLLVRSGEIPLEKAFFTELASWGEAGLGEALVEGIPKMEPELQGFAAGVLLQVRPDAARSWFTTALQNPEEERVLEVVDLLRELPTPEAGIYLTQVKGEWAPDLASVALVARGERPIGSLKRWLVPGKEGLEDTELALEAIRAARMVWKKDPGAPGSERVEGWIRALMEEPRLREEALLALGQRSGNRNLLQSYLNDSTVRVQLAAAEALSGGPW